MMSGTDCNIYTANQVRGIDHTAIHELGIPGYELMCRAGAAVVAAASDQYPSARHWLIMCGPGNNGGDGYVVARLAAESGINVSVCSLSDPRQLKGDAALAYTDWSANGGEASWWPDKPQGESFELVLDALLGTGIDREVRGEFRQAIAYLNQLPCPTLAIDIPSGLNSDTGCAMGCVVQAESTVTFVARKRGMYTAEGPDKCGRITFNDLSIPAEATLEQAASAGVLLSPYFLTEVIKPRLRNSHKGNFGHVLAVGGIQGMSGAIRLCGAAALRSGAGRVTLATDPAHAALINLGRPELMVKSLSGDKDCLSFAGSDHVVAVGPGLGETNWSETLLEDCLGLETALVVDADGLNLLALLSRQKPLKRDNWILTPHPAEAARLLGCEVTDIQKDRVLSATTIAERLGACVVLKGCGTIVADPSGQYAICPLGNPGMATAGSGDVLTGIIVALLGQGLSCFDAARAGVLAHARAGDLAAEKVGEIALIAGDIIDCLPGVWGT
jgi:NAD(P)H-hydrate epimerase